MRILVTEAASPLAYHLTSLLASEDIFNGQGIELVLCDHQEKQGVVTGVMWELQDCLHPRLTGVSISDDFLQSVKSADIVLALPSSGSGVRGDTRVQINHGLLTQKNFQGLNGAFYKPNIDMQDQINLRTKGPLSSAIQIVASLKDIYVTQEKQEAHVCPYTTLAHYQEEAEFGMPPEHASEWNCCYYDNDIKLFMMVISMETCKLEKQDDHIDKDSDSIAQFISRL